MPVTSCSEVQGLDAVLADKVGATELNAAVASAMSNVSVAWGSVTGKPSTFAPASHSHVIGDVTGLQTALDGKQAAGSYASASHNHSGVYEPAFAAGTTAQYLRGDKTWQTLPSGSDPWTWVKLTSDVSNSTTTLANTAITFTAQANTTYVLYFLGAFQSAATTTGIAVALDIPSGNIAGQIYHPVSATTSGGTEQIADNATTGATTGVRAATTNVPIGGEWIMAIGATGGTVTLTFRSEVASSAVTLKGGLCALGYRTI